MRVPPRHTAALTVGSPPTPHTHTARCSVQRVEELRKLESEYEEHYDEICAEEAARAEAGVDPLADECTSSGDSAKEASGGAAGAADDVADVLASYAAQHAHITAPIAISFTAQGDRRHGRPIEEVAVGVDGSLR